MNDHEAKIVDTMSQYGGSFVRQLALLWSLADADNSARIKAAWPEYIKQYEALVETLSRKETTA